MTLDCSSPPWHIVIYLRKWTEKETKIRGQTCLQIDFPPPAATSKSSGLITEEASILKAMGPVPKAKAVAPQPPPAAKKNKQVAEDDEDDEDDLMDAYRNTTATEALIPPDNKADDSEIQFKVPPVAGMLAVSSVHRCNFSVFHKTKHREGKMALYSFLTCK